MTIQVELSPEAEARLAAQAAVRGLALETYAGELLQDALGDPITGTGILTSKGVDEFFAAMTEGSESLPILTLEANERASYYGDRG